MGIRAYHRAVLDEHMARLDDDEELLDGYLDVWGEAPQPVGLPPAVSIDKSWDALQRLLAADPILSGAVVGLHPVGEDLGYGPAQLVRPDEVAAIHGAWSRAEGLVREGFVDPGVGDAYPGVWDEPDVLETTLLPHLAALGRVYGEAAEAKRAVLAWLE